MKKSRSSSLPKDDKSAKKDEHLKLPKCAESFEQFKVKNKSKHRILKALHLLPKKDKTTSVSVQIGAPAGGWNTDHGGPLVFRLSQYEKVNKELNEIICLKEKETEEFEHELLELRYENDRIKQKLTVKEEELEKLQHEQGLTKKRLHSLEHLNESTLLENEFLLEDKENVHKELEKSMKLSHRLQNEIKVTQEERDSFAELYINTKIKSSELLGTYLDQLNSSLEERRHWLQQLKFGSSRKRKSIIAAVENNIKLQEERNRLVEQVEFLSAKSTAQEMHIDKLQIEMSKMSKYVYAYQEKTGLAAETVAGEHISVCESGLSIPVPVLTSTPIKGNVKIGDINDKYNEAEDKGAVGDNASKSEIYNTELKRSRHNSGSSQSSQNSIPQKDCSKDKMLNKKSLVRFFEDLRISK